MLTRNYIHLHLMVLWIHHKWGQLEGKRRLQLKRDGEPGCLLQHVAFKRKEQGAQKYGLLY